MIKDVMVGLDGTKTDEARLAAANEIAELFHSHIIGLFLNPMPVLIAPEEGIKAAELLNEAREAGDKVEAKLIAALERLQKPVELRRFDIFDDEGADIAAREARTVDAFIALRRDGAWKGQEDLVENVLFGSGRHILLFPSPKGAKISLHRILIAWNGSRESSRAVGEAIPYLRKATEATLVIVDEDPPVELQAKLGQNIANHLRRHGINAAVQHARASDHDIGGTLISEAKRLEADVIVMGGYGHSRLRELLLGGTTYHLLHKSPVPLLIAH